MKALTKTDFNFPGQKSVYHGKVRDVYNINGEKLVMGTSFWKVTPRLYYAELFRGKEGIVQGIGS